MKIVGGSLALLYILSFVACLGYLTIPDVRLFAVLLLVLFVILLIASVSAARKEEWGRKLLVVANGFLFLYLVGLVALGIELLPSFYLLLPVSIAVFFGREKIRVVFQGKAPYLRKSILVIDDDQGLLKMIKPLLLSNGYSVLVATTGEKGLQIAKKQKPDLIILDVILPGIKGRQVCVNLKEDADTQRIPVLFLTAKNSPDDVQAEIAAGGIAHITKPFRAHRLLEEIERSLKA